MLQLVTVFLRIGRSAPRARAEPARDPDPVPVRNVDADSRGSLEEVTVTAQRRLEMDFAPTDNLALSIGFGLLRGRSNVKRAPRCLQRVQRMR